MKEKFFKINGQERENILLNIEGFLKKRSDLLFAYVHGSFISLNRFRDIDVAIYLNAMSDDPLQVELDLEAQLHQITKYPVDVRILNCAPLSFRYNTIKNGKRLVVIDDDARCDFEEMTVSKYFDFAPYRKMYLKEAFSRGI